MSSTLAAVQTVTESLQDSAALLVKLTAMAPELIGVAESFCHAWSHGGTVYALGNGGSAAEAQHLVAELVGRFERDNCLAAHALTTDTSILSAIANDFSFDEVYARQVRALVKPGDVVLAISTSGNSPSVINAAEEARKKGAIVVGLTGETGGKMAPLCDMCLKVPAKRTCRIQEGHLAIIHILCQLCEKRLAEINA